MSWLINNIGLIVSVALAICGAVVTVIGLIYKNSACGKVVTWLGKVLKSLPDFIRTAEKISDNAEEKKAYVMQQTELHCKAEGLALTEKQRAEISEQVDDMVKLSKDININSKTKTTSEEVEEVEDVPAIKPIEQVEGFNNEN